MVGLTETDNVQISDLSRTITGCRHEKHFVQYVPLNSVSATIWQKDLTYDHPKILLMTIQRSYLWPSNWIWDKLTDGQKIIFFCHGGICPNSLKPVLHGKSDFVAFHDPLSKYCLLGNIYIQVPSMSCAYHIFSNFSLRIQKIMCYRSRCVNFLS